MGAPIMGLVEIAARMGISKTRARQYVAEPGFPRGYLLSVGWVWMTADVEAWLRHRRPDLFADESPPGS
jgi:hypothetical protein